MPDKPDDILIYKSEDIVKECYDKIKIWQKNGISIETICKIFLDRQVYIQPSTLKSYLYKIAVERGDTKPRKTKNEVFDLPIDNHADKLDDELLASDLSTNSFANYK